MARIAKSLDTLRSQVNAMHPSRSKISDGWIGDSAHAARKSDHNPDEDGIVHALDITHDPAHEFDSWAFADMLRIKKDPRIKYVISNSRIFSQTESPWLWRPYEGSNAHAHHVHISVNNAGEDDTTPWDIGELPRTTSTAPKPPPPAPPPGITISMRDRMAKQIVAYEAVRDSKGKIKVHYPGDGSYEVAGVSSNSHPNEAIALRELIEIEKPDEAEARAGIYILKYTEPVTGWTKDAGVEFYLRDSFFNRGPTGAAKILQMAVGTTVDGQVGQQTRAAMAMMKPDVLLTGLRAAREKYERDVIGYRPQYWAGLTNRWNNALTAAKKFQSEGAQLVSTTTGAGAGAAVVIGAGTAAATEYAGYGNIAVVAGFCIAVAIFIAVMMLRRK